MYIGETGRSLPIRMSEHMRDVRNEKETSGVYIHTKLNPSHEFPQPFKCDYYLQRRKTTAQKVQGIASYIENI